MTVTLRAITQENVRAVCELELADDQRKLVAPASYTVAESAYEEGGMLRAIYSGEVPVGVLFVGLDEETPYIVRFMVDVEHQRRGVGRQAGELVLSELRDRGFAEVEVSFQPVDGGAEGFWRKLGFEPTGRESHGEPVFRRSLSG